MNDSYHASPEQDAPLPQMGYGYNGQQHQPWSIAPKLGKAIPADIVQEAIVGMVYPRQTNEDRRRCLLAAMLSQMMYAVSRYVLVALVLVVFVGVIFPDAVSNLLIGVVALLVVIVLQIALLQTVENIALHHRMSRATDTTVCYLLTSWGIYQSDKPDRPFLAYADVGKILERKGDILVFQRRALVGGFFWIPRSGFQDQEQAQRFCMTIRQLHAAKGDAGALSLSLRTEFTTAFLDE